MKSFVENKKVKMKNILFFTVMLLFFSCNNLKNYNIKYDLKNNNLIINKKIVNFNMEKEKILNSIGPYHEEEGPYWNMLYIFKNIPLELIYNDKNILWSMHVYFEKEYPMTYIDLLYEYKNLKFEINKISFYNGMKIDEILPELKLFKHEITEESISFENNDIVFIKFDKKTRIITDMQLFINGYRFQ